MSEGYQGSDLYTASVRAGKRTYFFDVKATRGNDLFLTITESKKVGYEDEGNMHYEKHKIFLYKEDFENFLDAMTEAMAVIKEKQGKDGFRSAESPRKPYNKTDEENTEDGSAHSVDVSFDDLGGADSSDGQ